MRPNALKVTLLSLLATCTISTAGLVNAISVIVNDEPITLYEIHKTSDVKNISLREALDVLIQEKLEASQIKRLNITTNDFEVQSRMETIASQNNISVSELTAFIQSRGMSEAEYKAELKENIKQEKLYQRIFANAITPLDQEEARRYYEANPDQFQQAGRFDVMRYEASDPALLERISASPMSVIPEVTTTRETLMAQDLDPRSNYYLNQTKEGEFTAIITNEGNAHMYLVEKKSETSPLPFARVQRQIEQHLETKARQKAIDNYFEKLKSRADIVVLRRP
ncbi:MAG: SurA N-terminal domain-containing protein [Marichromatium sp.]|nr:SurA N-terminal domain-containing protein [Marichromatium sp.]